MEILGIKMNQFLIMIRSYSSPSAGDMGCEKRIGFAELVDIGPSEFFYKSARTNFKILSGTS